MNLLLDSHALLWWLAGDPLDRRAASEIGDPRSVVMVSAATVWELAIKRGSGKLRYEGSLVDQVEADGFDLLAVSAHHAEAAGALPRHHHDPFDRMLIAQAQAERLTVVTRDPAFEQYEVDVLPC